MLARRHGWVETLTHTFLAWVAVLIFGSLGLLFVALLFLFVAQPSLAMEKFIRVPLSCRVLAVLHGIEVPTNASLDDARDGLAQAEQRADANLPGVRLCLNQIRKAIANAEKQ